MAHLRESNDMLHGFLAPPVLARLLPFLIYVLMLTAGDLLARVLPQADLRWLYGAQVVMVVAALVAFRRQYVELGARPGGGALMAAVLVGLAVFALWIHLALPYLSFEVGRGFDPRDGGGAVIVPLAAVRVMGAALVVPLMEELFWRSFVMRWIDRHEFLELAPTAVSLRAVAISSLLFGLEHGLWFAGILAGLAYAELYRRSGSLWPPIVGHAVTNAALGAWVLATGSWSFW